jgi:hypothetical protein
MELAATSLSMFSQRSSHRKRHEVGAEVEELWRAQVERSGLHIPRRGLVQPLLGCFEWANPGDAARPSLGDQWLLYFVTTGNAGASATKT